MDYVFTWGIYQWIIGKEDIMIDARDREEFLALKPMGKVFKCVSVEGEMIVLEYGMKRFQVNLKCYRVVKEPKYKLVDKVEIISKSLVGQVIEIYWHLKDEVPYYYLEIEGKKAKRRYKDGELEANEE